MSQKEEYWVIQRDGIEGSIIENIPVATFPAKNKRKVSNYCNKKYDDLWKFHENVELGDRVDAVVKKVEIH